MKKQTKYVPLENKKISRSKAPFLRFFSIFTIACLMFLAISDFSDIQVSALPASPAEGCYFIKCKATGKYLDVKDGSTNSNAEVWTYAFNGTPAQQWHVKSEGSGYYSLAPQTNLGSSLDIYDASITNGNRIQTWVDNDTAAQRWRITLNADGATYRVWPGMLSQSKAMDVDVATGNVQIWDLLTNNTNQHWEFIPCTPTYAKRQSRGVGNMKYYIDSTANGYTSPIWDAKTNWVYTGWTNPIYLDPVSSSSGTHIDFYGDYDSFFYQYSPYITYAGTICYSSGSVSLNPDVSDWYYAEIIINKNRLATSGPTLPATKGTIAHEIGHALGLAHTKYDYSIMCQTGEGRAVQTVQKIDNDAILRKYP